MLAIKDMEMPSDCASCDIRSGNFCYVKNKPPYNIKGNVFTRDDDCPLLEIPTYGTCKDCSHRDPENKMCDCGHSITWQLPRPDEWYCKDFEK